MSANKVYVLDTQHYLAHNTNFIKELCDGGNNIIVIPETVLIELEDFKKNFTELGLSSEEFCQNVGGRVKSSKWTSKSPFVW